MCLPLNVDVPMTRLPVANWVLIGLILCASVAGWCDERIADLLAGLDRPAPQWRAPDGRPGAPDSQQIAIANARQFGRARFRPSWWQYPIIAVTCTFLHADLLHLAGNVVFLWVFGNALNYKLGHARFVALYLAGGMLGSFAVYTTLPGLPCIGASGAIMTVVGGFLVFFPRNNVSVVVPLWVPMWLESFEVSSWVMILLYVGLDLLMLWLDPESHVGYIAHLVGFFLGFVYGLLLAVSGKLESTPYEQNLLEVLQRRE
ncbi:MAG: rhomboid family intramembrane serine protease [Thermoguttaceae bacterium]|nr:rhomboid family intramembrane serine protease [Thermoguttaceae bacterium]